MRDGSIGELVKALRKLELPSERSEKRRTQVLYCLEPLSRAAPGTSLREQVNDAKLIREVFERTVRSLTRLEVLG